MAHKLFSGVAVLALCVQLFASVPLAAATPAAAGTTGNQKVTLLVRFKLSTASADADSAVKGAGAQTLQSFTQIRTRSITVAATAQDAVTAALAKNPNVESVNPTVSMHKASTPNDPNDPSYAQQWALPKIAWDQAYGSVTPTGSATIAVLDTGVDGAQPDLQSHLVAGLSNLNGVTSGDPTVDPNGHGTALAGIAAAGVNDSTGMAGVDYAGASVAPVQVLGADGTGTDADVVAGVLWAANPANHVNVILMGFSSPDYSSALANAVSYAEGKGVVIVAATGNDGSTAASYPAGLPGVVGVASSDQNDTLASSSNTGSASVAAPGVNILATQVGGGTTSISGTSPASAEVAGLAALLVANGTQDVAGQIRGAVDPVSGASFGRINVAKALGAPAPAPAPAPSPSPTPSSTPPTYTAAKTNTTTTLTADHTTADAGLPVTFTATVTPNPGGGTVSFFDGVNNSNNCVGGTAIGSQALGTNAQASVTVSNLLPGSHSIMACYSGTGTGTAGFTPSNSSLFTLTVTQAPITIATSITGVSGSATYGGTATLTATLKDAGNNLLNNQTISFKIGTTAVGTATTNASGVATLSNVTLPSGYTNANTYSGAVTAGFTAGGNYTGSSNTGDLTVGKANADCSSVAGYTVTYDGNSHTATGSCLGVDGTTALAGLDLSGTTHTNAGSWSDSWTFTDVTGNYNNTGGTVSDSINKAGQSTLTVDSPNSGIYGDHLVMSASGGTTNGAISFAVTSDSNACSILTSGTDAGQLAITSGTGTCKITATMAGDGNYSDVSSAAHTVTINPKTLTITASSPTVTYGDAAPTITPSYSGFIGTDNATDSLSTQPTCTTVYTQGSGVAGSPYTTSCSGAVSSNYSPSYVTGSVTVNPKSLTASITADNKIYDGSMAAVITNCTLGGVVSGDDVSCTTSNATFDTANVGTGKSVTATVALSGAAAGNYVLTATSAGTTANITPKSLTGSFTAQSKTYDGNTSATILTRSLSGVVSSDTNNVSLTGGSASFADKTVGTGKTVTGTGFSLSGMAAGNYAFVSSTLITTADIAPRALTVSGTGQNKVYDGTTGATVTLSDDRVPGDVFTDSYTSATFVDQNVGAGKTVSVSGIAISGTDAGNYTFNTTASTTADITPKSLTITASSATVTYGDPVPTITPNYDGFVTGDYADNSLSTQPACTTTYTQGSGVAGSPYSTTCSGAVSSNYSPSYINGSVTVNKAPALPISSRFYTGATVFWTTSSSTSTATLFLSATLQDQCAVNPNYLCWGDITTARVTFAVRSGGTVTPINGATNLPVGLVDQTNTHVGSAAASVQYNLGSKNYDELDIVVLVSGNYTDAGSTCLSSDPACDTLVSVERPITANTVKGAGTSVNNLPGGTNVTSGVLKGNDDPSKGMTQTQVLFDLGYTKSGSNPQGQVMIQIVSYYKPDGTLDSKAHTYLIKSSSISTLGVTKGLTVNQVQFTAKASVQDITDPAHPVSIDGGALLQMNATDGKPGTSGSSNAGAGDMISVQANNSKTGAVWFSSNWNGAKTIQSPVVSNGGDVVIN